MSGRHHPTPQRFLEDLQGFQRTQVLRAALELELFTALGEGPTDADALARSVRADPRGVRILCDYLVTLGFLAKDGSEYRPSEDAALFLDRRSPSYIGDVAKFLAAPAVMDAFAHAVEAVRTGGGGTALDSMTPDHPIWLEYAREMGPLFVAPAAAIAEHLAGSAAPVRRILDVAAGHGAFGVEIAVRFPGAELTALDWPSVLPIAQARAESAGVGDRFHGVPGDIFATPFGSTFDVVVLANFLHHFDPLTCDRLLRRTFESLADTGRAVVVEFVPNADRVTPPSVAQFAFTMLTTTRHGDAYTSEELEGMLRRAGLGTIERLSLPHSPQRALIASRG
jgi:2-polyprenyl-3-methyl-5-hydroxy-6-metoxy-1,4-benzoquinol methylase